jgi:exosome complex component RRP42
MEAIEMIKANYTKELLLKGARADSRGALDFREIKIKKNVLENTEGSAQVDIGNTRVLAGVKMVVEEPMEDSPKSGNLIVSGELLPLASPEYETGPPSPEAIEFARVTDRGIRAANCINLDDLFIEEGKVWTVFIDLYVLNYDGNLFDAGTLAAMAALSVTKVPTYRDGKDIRTERIKPLKLDNFVGSTTFAKIGDKYVLDPCGDEEKAASTRLTITTDGTQIRAMQKGLGGSWKRQELMEMMDISLKSHERLKRYITE